MSGAVSRLMSSCADMSLSVVAIEGRPLFQRRAGFAQKPAPVQPLQDVDDLADMAWLEPRTGAVRRRVAHDAIVRCLELLPGDAGPDDFRDDDVAQFRP